MRAEIELPKVGDSAFEGIVGRWLKAVGDPVEEFEPVVEIESDKAVVEMPSPASGILAEIFVASGQRVPVGTVIGVVDDAAETPSSPSPAGEVVQVLLPKVADSAFEGTIARWLKQPGDEVEEFEPLLEIEGDKAIVEMPSPATGRLTEVLVPAGQRAPVDTTIALIAVSGSPSQPAGDAGMSPGEAPSEPPPAALRRKVSPLAAKLAARYGLDARTLPGRASAARITVEDVRRRLDLGERDAGQTAVGVVPPIAGGPARAAPASRRAIAEHMTRSWLTIPHGSVTALADVGHLVHHRQAHPGLTYTPFFAAALVRALEGCPWAIPSGDGVHLGIAVATDDGLLVPVLHRPQTTDFGAFAAAVEDLVARARAQRLRPQEMSGSNFTLTNVGVFGAVHSQPIIPEGNAGILGIGAIQPRAVAREGYLAVRPSAYLSAVVDRRAMNEGLADRFLAEVLRQLGKVV